MDRGVIVDGVDLGALGIGLVSVGGRHPDRDSDWQGVNVPGRDGELLVSSEPATDSRILDMRFVIESTDRASMLALVRDARFYFHERKVHTVRFVDDETVESVGVVVAAQYPAIGPDLVQDAVEFRVRMKVSDPRELAVSATVVGSIGASPIAVPLGPDRSWPVLTVTGSGSFIILYKNSAGATVKTLQVAGAVAPVTINMETAVITDNAGNGSAFLTAASDFPWALDPLDGDYPAAAWPTLQVSSGTLSASYKKAY